MRSCFCSSLPPMLLGALLGETIREFGYEYDFGDGWEHRIVVESAGKRAPATHNG